MKTIHIMFCRTYSVEVQVPDDYDDRFGEFISGARNDVIRNRSNVSASDLLFDGIEEG